MLLSVPDLIKDVREKLRLVDSKTAKLEMAKLDNVVFLDVREPQEVIEKPILGAINIPRGVLEMQMLQRFSDAELPIYTHCATGVRASLAGEQLQRVGYKNVSVITCDLEALCEQMNA